MQTNLDNLTELQTETIKIHLDLKSKNTTLQLLKEDLKESMQLRDSYTISPSIPEQDVIEYLQGEFHCTVLIGITDGCYGSSSGNRSKGFTMYISLIEFPKSWVEKYENEDSIEYFNPVLLIANNALALKEVDDEVIDILKDTHLKHAEDNTSNDENYLCTELEYIILNPDSDANIMFAFKVHCGGDIRGNYSNWTLARFESLDGIFSCLSPYSKINEKELS